MGLHPVMTRNLPLQNPMLAAWARKRSSVGKEVERPGLEDGFTTA